MNPLSLASVPIDVDRDDARDAAASELSDPAYHAADPSWFDRAVGWLVERIADLLNGIGSVGPGGLIGLVILAGLAVVLGLVIRQRVGRIARSGAHRGAVFDGRALAAADHRRAADVAESQGNLAEAVRERFRAIVRELEQRGVLDEVSGRTVDEIADQAGRALPDAAADFRAAAAIFDDVVYGDRPATVDGYGRLVALDNQVQRPALLGASW